MDDLTRARDREAEVRELRRRNDELVRIIVKLSKILENIGNVALRDIKVVVDRVLSDLADVDLTSTTPEDN